MNSTEPRGPIRPADATDGWQLVADVGEYWLVRLHGVYNLEIHATAASSCVLRVHQAGALVREASATDIGYLKDVAQQWIHEH
ncbi:hypothetical protein [Nocardia terpenica]|uniref:Uncharacterized protein n=1 Tax=Nocardia terpenica TaxID=455432 RepID=A0A164K891_9NOCA|nr:hypothetical protein [Nocardia terpenica]KZM71135.1 hypothetical protein AWN90_42240 [Nocardia terpenica]NQE89540.1 hypothetical protein [Nocardia terpenica]